MSERNAEWHARHKRGETYAAIAQSVGSTRNAVSGAVDRHRKQLQDGRVKADGPTRAEIRAAEPPKMPRAPRRQPCDPAGLARFKQAADAGLCLWIDGDLRDHATCCGQPRSIGRYCAAHRARAIQKQKPVSI